MRHNQANSEEFHRPRVDHEGEDGCPPPAKASLCNKQAECEPQRNEAHAHRQCLPDAGSYVAAVAVSCGATSFSPVSFGIDVLTHLVVTYIYGIGAIQWQRPGLTAHAITPDVRGSRREYI